MDEFSLSGPTLVAKAPGESGDVVAYQVMPESMGPLERPREEIRGGAAQYNAALLRRTLYGEQTGAAADIVALNAGAALYVSGHMSSISEGVRQAQDALRVGRAIPTLNALATTSRSRLTTSLRISCTGTAVG